VLTATGILALLLMIFEIQNMKHDGQQIQINDDDVWEFIFRRAFLSK
jgi:hypothetical protein